MFSPQSVHSFPCVQPQSLLNIIAGVLHVGNTQFGEGEEGETYITTEAQINSLAKVRTVPLVLPDFQICTRSCEEARPGTDVLLFCSCWLLMALPSGRHSHTRSSLPRGRRWLFLLSAYALTESSSLQIEWLLLCLCCICRWSVRSVSSSRCHLVTLWPRPRTVGRSCGWWRRSTSPLPPRLSLWLDVTKKGNVKSQG